MKRKPPKATAPETPPAVVIYVAHGETYDGGIGIYNRETEIAAFFDRAAARQSATENSSGVKATAEGYVTAHNVMDAPATDKPAKVFIAYGVASGGGQGRDETTELGAWFSEAAAKQASDKNSSGPWYDPKPGYVKAFDIRG